MTPATLDALLRQRVATHAQARAYSLLDDQCVEREAMSYLELYEAACRVAAVLDERFERRSRVVLAYPSGLAFIAAFFGCVLAGMIAVPAAPPRRHRENERFKAILRDARPAGVLAASEWADLLRSALSETSLAVIATDGDATAAGDVRDPGAPLAPGDIAYLQYTSGSISAPKGVVITHANVLSNSVLIDFVEQNDADSISLTWLPNFHDMGLVEGVLQPLFSGTPGLIMTPASFLQRPRRWLEAITRYRVTNSGAPNFAYQMCVDQASEEGAPLDLRSWRVAYNGAEPIRPDTMRRFLETFAPVGFREQAFYPVYGLAEATLMVTSGRREDLPRYLTVDRDRLERGEAVPATPETRHTCTLVASGAVLSGQCEHALDVIIVDPTTDAAQPDGTIGEVRLAGPSIAAGYWQRPADTEETFAASVHGRPGAALLRTGDLGFLRDGWLFLTGRVKDIIITNGRNLYPQDLEWLAATAHAIVRPWGCAAFAIDAHPDDRIVIICEAKRHAQPQQLQEAAAAVRERIATELDIEPPAVVFIRANTLPKTSSGKVQRLICRDLLRSGALEIEYSVGQTDSEPRPESPSEAPSVTARLRDELRAILTRGRPAAAMADDAVVAEYVNDSLQAVKLCHEIERRYGVAVPVSALLGRTTLASLAALISSRQPAAPSTAAAAPVGAPAPGEAPGRDDGPIRLSYGQEALWFLAAVAPASVAYHICRAVEIVGPLDAATFQRALDAVASRHAALRTRFTLIDGIPHQAFDSARTIAFASADVGSLGEDAVRRLVDDEAWRPFDLEHDSLIRIHLLRRDHDRHLLLIALHHIVADLWSVAYLLEELWTQYEALASGRWVSPTRLASEADYAEVVRWQRALRSSAEGEALRARWLARVRTVPAETPLPLDRPRPSAQTFRGAVVDHDLDEALTTRIDRRAREMGTTPFGVMLATYLIFLHRTTGQSRVSVGVPVSGRAQQRFARTIGFLANVNVVTSEMTAGSSWRTVLTHTQAQLVAALDAQDYPFPLLVEDAGLTRDPRVSPLFQQMFSLESPPEWEALAPLVAGRDGGRVDRGALTLVSRALPQRGAQFDLHTRFVRHEGRLLGSWHFNVDLFDEATVRRWAEAYTHLLRAALDDPDGNAMALPAWMPGTAAATGVQGERVALAPDDTRLHLEIDRQARETPDRVAVSFGDPCATYGHLARTARSLARALRRRGVRDEACVAVCLDRSLELPVVLLGILYAGGSYLPIATDYPPRRIAHLLGDAQPTLIVTDEAHAPLVEGRVVLLRDLLEDEPRARRAWRRPATLASDACAAYVIFTSGSTGRPKGAVNTHGGAINRLRWMQRAYPLGAGDRVLQKTPYTFDVSVWELFWPLLTGAQLVMAGPHDHRSPSALCHLIAEREVTVLHFVPSMLAVFTSEADAAAVASVRHLVCSGEVLPKTVERAARALFPGAVHNLYGPTEAAVDVTAWTCPADDPGATVPIGLPIANTTIRLLDLALRPVIPGASGELAIAGPGLARGYVGRPDLTAAVFVPDPYAANGARMYRTGDQARLRGDGAIEFLGRRDHQRKVRGFRVELLEIEAHLQSHPSLAEAAVTTRDDDGAGTRLIACYVVRDGCSESPRSLRRWLAERLPDYMVPAFFFAMPALPRLESGKIDRAGLPDAGRAPRAAPERVAPRDATETLLAEIWTDTLRVEAVGVDETFFELGGDSLSIVRAAAKAKARGLPVSAELIYQHQTIARISAHVRGAADLRAPEAAPYRAFDLLDPADSRRVPAGVDDVLPLARLQEAMVYHIENSANSIAYVTSVHVRAPFELPCWERALAIAMAGHPYLRVSFARAGFRGPVQLVHHHVAPPLYVEDIRHLSGEEQDAHLARWVSAEKKRRFAWDVPPLFRLTLHRRTEESVQITLTEISLDGWSIAVLLTELCRTYRTLLRGGRPEPPPEPEPPYGEFVRLERAAAGDRASEAIWGAMLAPDRVAALPRWPAAWRLTDRSLHSRRTVHVAADVVDRLRARAGDATCPLKSVFLAAHLAVLRTLTGRDDVLTALITHGRPDTDGSDMAVGLYTNTLPLQIGLGGLRWIDLLSRAHAAEAALYPHRRYPFADIYKRWAHPLLNEAAFNFTHFHIYEDLLRGDPDLEVLSVLSFDQTYFTLTAYFNLLPADRRLSIDLDYNPTELAPEQVATMAGYYERALQALAVAPDARVADTCLLSPDEVERELYAWNPDGAPGAREADLLEVILGHGRTARDRVAIVHGDVTLTYGALARRVTAVCRGLCALGVGPDVAVGVSLDRSPELVIGLLAILAAGGYFVPLDPDDPRRDAIVRESGVRLVLAVSPRTSALDPQIPVVRCADLMQRGGAPPIAWRRWIPPDALAYCIYTSGSTGTPKGVTIPRRALSGFAAAAARAYALTAADRVLQFAALSFDAALEEIFCTLRTGATLVMRTDDSLDSFDRFLRACAREATTVLDLPTAFWHQLTTALHERGTPLPSCVRTVILGGEKMRPGRLAAWREIAPAAAVLHNSYGPTETTIVALQQVVDAVGTPDEDVPIGRPLAGVAAYVLDGAGRIGPVGRRGELCIGGASLARGYHGRGDLTAERFRPNPFAAEPGSRLYWTGDIVARRPDGAIDFVGRQDEQVKVRGFRVELAEIERVLQADPRVSEAAVVAHADDRTDAPALVAYVVPAASAQDTPDRVTRALTDAVARRLPCFMVPAAIELRASLPRTRTGKVDKAALGAPRRETPSADAIEALLAPGPIEATVAAIYRACLRGGAVSRHARFVELGGDSLSAMQIVSRIEERFGVRITAREIFDAPDLAALADRIDRLRGVEPATVAEAAIPRAAPGTPLEISVAQARLWFLHQFDPDSTSYNVPAAFRIRGPLNVAALRQAFEAICQRHEVLRTRFVDHGHTVEPVLTVPFVLPFAHVDLHGTNGVARDGLPSAIGLQEVGRGFDLTSGPLIRVTLVRLDPQESLLVVVMHHIVTDEWCAEILIDEIKQFYEAAIAGLPPALPRLVIQYSDFARWQTIVVSGPRLDALREFWRRELAGAPPLIHLPLDVPRDQAGAARGARHAFQIAPEVSHALRALGATHEVSLFMVLLAIYQAWLHAFTEMTDFVVGSPIAGRFRPETERLVGFFANLLVLRARLRPDATFAAHLGAVRETTLACYDHRTLSFAQLVSCLNPERDLAYAPLVQVIFGLWPRSLPDLRVDGLHLHREALYRQHAKYDLEMQIADGGDALEGFLEYNTALFLPQTIADMVAAYQHLCAAVVDQPETTLAALRQSIAIPTS